MAKKCGCEETGAFLFGLICGGLVLCVFLFILLWGQEIIPTPIMDNICVDYYGEGATFSTHEGTDIICEQPKNRTGKQVDGTDTFVRLSK